jgi:hypothetical protein
MAKSESWLVILSYIAFFLGPVFIIWIYRKISEFLLQRRYIKKLKTHEERLHHLDVCSMDKERANLNAECQSVFDRIKVSHKINIKGDNGSIHVYLNNVAIARRRTKRKFYKRYA